MNDNEFLGALRERAARPPRTPVGESDQPKANAPTALGNVRLVSSQLQLSFPSLLARIYTEVADGGFGPGYGLFPIEVYPSQRSCSETMLDVYATLAQHPSWPRELLPLCDWGCANWSCLDCRTDDGAIVTLAGEDGFTSTTYTLRSWLRAWLDNVALWDEMFERGPITMGINPFTKKPIEIMGRGKPRGTSWP